MSTRNYTSSLLLNAGLALAIGAGAWSAWAGDRDEEAPFAVAKLYVQLNDTDGDLGLHALVDGEGWRRMGIGDPRGREVVDIRVNGRLRRQGLTELFFESAEPDFDTLPPEAFFARFPAGEYEVDGVTLDGRELESAVNLSHAIPAPPGNVTVSGQPAADDCDAPTLPLVWRTAVIDWDPVTESHPEIGDPTPGIEITGYQFVVQREAPDLLVYSVDLPPTQTRARVPQFFLKHGSEFKFEILVREASGNETVVESCFEVAR